MADAQPDILAIFTEAIRHESPADRSKFLDEACGSDAMARQRVETLLRAHFDAGNFLGGHSHEAPPTSDLPPAENPGTQVGPYKLLQVIGEGGMGVVYMAEQTEPVQRRVALKIIKPGMDSRQFIARFEAERQALAMMDHPNIAKVLDAGTTDAGQPFFVLELVKGVTLTQYCDEKHLTLKQRLELFVPVCQAIQHAHTKGIIHRDLKPTNVLVAEYDNQPVPKIIDFGVAKATAQKLTEKSMFTVYGQVVGTLEYMSPEQAKLNQLDIDTRSDIYSLGVLLYELLAGSTPFDRTRLHSAAFDEMLRIIREEEPPKPSTRLSTADALPSIAANRSIEPARLSRQVKGELDWIVMKCLEKERNRRYETANAFAKDLEHFLHDEPVAACPPSAVYRLRKFARRNKTALVTACLIASSLVAGIIVSTWQVVRTTRAERVAQEQRKMAERNFQKARQAVDEYFTLVSESKLLDVPGLQPLRKELLEAALRYYQAMRDEHADDPGVLADIAISYIRVGKINHELDRNDDAMAAIESGLVVVERLRRDYPRAAEHHRRLAGFWKVGRAITNKMATPKDPAAAHRILTRFQEVWEELSREHPSVEEFYNDLAGIYDLLALLEGARGAAGEPAAFGRAVVYSRKAITIWEQLDHAHPQVAGYRDNMAGVYSRLAWELTNSGQRERSGEATARAGALRDELIAQFPNIPTYAALRANRVNDLASDLARSQPQEAEGKFREAQQAFQKLVTDFPGALEYRRRLAVVQFNLAELLANVLQRPDEALPVYRQRIKQIEEAVAAFPQSQDLRQNLGLSCGRLAAHVEQDPTQFQQAEELRRRGISILESLANDYPRESQWRRYLAEAHRMHGSSLELLSRPDDAQTAYREAFRVLEKSCSDFPELQNHRNLLADTCIRIVKLAVTSKSRFDNPAETLVFGEKAVELKPEDGTYWNALGAACYRAGKWEDAVSALEKSMQLRQGGDGFDRFFLALAQGQLGNQEAARAWYHQGVEWMDKHAPNDQELARLKTEAAALIKIDDGTNTKSKSNEE